MTLPTVRPRHALVLAAGLVVLLTTPALVATEPAVARPAVPAPITQVAAAAATPAATTTTLIDWGSTWTWAYPSAAMPTGWQSGTFTGVSTAQGKAPLGFGSPSLGTTLTRKATADPARTLYVRSTFAWDPATMASVTLTTWADDGIVVHVGGKIVGSRNMTGAALWTTCATAAPTTATARKNPLVITLDAASLARTATQYTVVAEVHQNWRATTDLSFDMQVTARRAEAPQQVTKALDPFFLNTTFGADPATTRTITWLALKPLEAPVVEVAPAGGQFTPRTVRPFPGTCEAVGQIFTTYSSCRVEVTGLTPATTYRYRIVNTSRSPGVETTWYGPIAELRTAPATVSSFTFLNFADSQGDPVSTYAPYWGNTLAQAMDRYPQAAFLTQDGDMIENFNWPHLEYWYKATDGRLSSPAFYPVLGNHEALTTTYVPLLKQLFSPGNENGYPLNYSFVYGNALIVGMDTNRTTAQDLSRQATWFTRTVAAKAKGRFVIVIMHKSPYGGQHSTDDDTVDIRRVLTPAFEAAGVNLVLSGHDHNYIRTHPMKNGKPVTAHAAGLVSTGKTGPVYLIARNSGQKTLPLVSRADRPWIDVQWDPGSGAAKAGSTVYAAITVDAKAVTVKAMTADGRTVDTLRIEP